MCKFNFIPPKTDKKYNLVYKFFHTDINDKNFNLIYDFFIQNYGNKNSHKIYISGQNAIKLFSTLNKNLNK